MRKWTRAASESVTALILIAVAGCVRPEMPLRADGGYPAEWPEITPPDAKCESLQGEYRNDGMLVTQDGQRAPLQLSELLTSTRGGPSATVTVETVPYHRATKTRLGVAAGSGAPRYPDPCICNQQTLLCVAKTTTWTVPLFAGGGTQLNVYLTSARDGSLIAKLQSYSAGLAGPVPYFYKKSEPWARFERAAPVAEPRDGSAERPPP